ncbi:E3 ubiquitin-protein ligase arih1 [Tyrophagus putrescentiae]|nr:E3 ubiquitin-protein ligase arih1 [Tyrophagus putrescentiae]
MSNCDSDEEVLYDSEDGDFEDNDDVDDGVLGLGGSSGSQGGQAGPDGDEYPYQVLSIDEVTRLMVETIKEVNLIVQLPQTTTRILLNHFKWDKEKLYEKYYAEEDPEALFAAAHVINPNLAGNLKGKGGTAQGTQAAGEGASGTVKKRRTRSQQGVKIECVICYLDYPELEMVAITCGHQFCKSCWVAYLTTKIMEEGVGPSISCADHQCDILVDDETVLELITDKAVIRRYKQLITNNFVECNRLVRWCPKPACGHVVKVEHCAFKQVQCVCKAVFCFACGADWHYPLRCDLMTKWQKKCSDDSETFNWIAANTKDCPQCKMPIEKNGGCNHMWCRNPSCKFEFCWLCLGDWRNHGYNPCNRYSETEANQAKTAQDRARAVLQRYLFYCNRYMNHMQSLKFEHKLYENVRVKMEEMQKHQMTWVEVQFLIEAVDVLVSCRSMLMYTYAFAYYLVKNNQVHIFEDNQKDLEAATEQLSEYLERDMTGEGALQELKRSVQDKYRYCEQRRKALLQHVQEGYDTDSWTLNAELTV